MSILPHIPKLDSNCEKHYNAIFILVEGNIGAGKTSLVARLAAEFPRLHDLFQGVDESPRLKTLMEPVTELVSSTGRNLLEGFYADPHLYTFEFQTQITKEYLTLLMGECSAETVKWRDFERKLDIIVMERSLFSARFVFTEVALQRGYINQAQYQFLVRQYEACVSHHVNFPCLHGLIYIKSSPVKVTNPFHSLCFITFFKCMERIQKRGRESEVAQLSFLNLDYVTEVGKKYTSWIESPDMLRKVLDSNVRRHKVE